MTVLPQSACISVKAPCKAGRWHEQLGSVLRGSANVARLGKIPRTIWQPWLQRSRASDARLGGVSGPIWQRWAQLPGVDVTFSASLLSILDSAVELLLTGGVSLSAHRLKVLALIIYFLISGN